MGIIEQLQQQVRELTDRVLELERRQRTPKQEAHGFVHLATLQRKHSLSRYMARQVFQQGRNAGLIKTVIHQTSSGSTVELIDEQSFSTYIANPKSCTNSQRPKKSA